MAIENIDRFIDLLYDEAREIGFQNADIELKPGSEPGMNYLGEVLRAKIRGKKDGEDATFDRFIKVIPLKHPLRQIKLSAVFKQEIQFYEEVLTLFDNIIKTKNGDRYYHATLYRFRTEEYKEVMIMNDLLILGFKNSSIGRTLDFEHTAAVLRQLGHFHALSFAARSHLPHEFEKIAVNRWLDVFTEKTLKEFSDKIVYDSTAVIMQFLENESAVSAVQIILSKMDVIKAGVIADEIEPYAVINHGDLWTNNIMFRYSKDNKLQDVLFVDYQSPRYCSPVVDLFFFLFTSVDDKVRANDLTGLFNIYYASLKDKLLRLKCDPNMLFPESVFRQHLKKFCSLGLVNALMLLPVFTNPSHVIEQERFSNLGKSDVQGVIGSGFTDLYKKRVNAIMNDCLKHGLID